MPKDPDKEYGRNKIATVQTIYILMAFIWIGLILILSLYNTSPGGWIILAIPFVVFLIGFLNASVLSISVEVDLASTNFLTLGLIIIIPLLTWISGNYNGDKTQFILIVITALILSLLSMIDIWVKKKWITVVRHIKSALQTMSLTLLIFLLFTYYMHHTVEQIPSNPNYTIV